MSSVSTKVESTMDEVNVTYQNAAQGLDDMKRCLDF